jgi:hypothetical protein
MAALAVKFFSLIVDCLAMTFTPDRALGQPSKIKSSSTKSMRPVFCQRSQCGRETTLTQVKDARRKVFLILDNLNVHKAKAVNAWLEEHADQIAVFYVSPYSPELNPSEYFSGDLKGAIQRAIPSRDVVELDAPCSVIHDASRNCRHAPAPTSRTSTSAMPRKSNAITPGQ